jgi:hypothetical protein
MIGRSRVDQEKTRASLRREDQIFRGTKSTALAEKGMFRQLSLTGWGERVQNLHS